MTKEKTGRPVGRPTKYDPAYCDTVEEVMGEGYSFTAFCGHIGIAKDTGYNWVKEYDLFSDATKRGRAKRLLFLEKRLFNTGMPPAQITATIFALKNADREEWADKVVNEHTGPGGGPVQQVSMTGEEFAKIARNVADEV